MPGPIVGREAKLYYNSGTFGSPTWTEIVQAIDVAINIDATRGDLSSRRSLWQMEGKALQSLETTFGYRIRQGVSDSVFTALRGHALNTAKVEFAVADGTINTNTTQYLRFTSQVVMGVDQPMTDGVSANFTAFLTYEEDTGTMREPSWVVVGS
jgi:hypothetical protein